MSEPINVNIADENQLQLTSFSQAKALKEAGFDWEVNTWFLTEDIARCEMDNVIGEKMYNANSNGFAYSRPTVALALKWLRKVKGLHVGVNIIGNRWEFVLSDCVAFTTLNGGTSISHDLAESAGLDKGLQELLKNKL